MVTTNVDIPIGYLVNSAAGLEERPTNIGLNPLVTKTHRVGQPQEEQVITESPRMKPTRVEPSYVEPPRVESPRFEPPRVEQPRMELPRVDPPPVEQPRVEPPRMEQPRF